MGGLLTGVKKQPAALILIWNPEWCLGDGPEGGPGQDCRIWPEDKPIPAPWVECEIATRVGARSVPIPITADLVTDANELEQANRRRAVREVFQDFEIWRKVAMKQLTQVLDDQATSNKGKIKRIRALVNLFTPSDRPEKEADRQPTQDEAARHPEHGTSPGADGSGPLRICVCGHGIIDHSEPGANGLCMAHLCRCPRFREQDPHPIGDKAAEPSAVSSDPRSHSPGCPMRLGGNQCQCGSQPVSRSSAGSSREPAG